MRLVVGFPIICVCMCVIMLNVRYVVHAFESSRSCTLVRRLSSVVEVQKVPLHSQVLQTGYESRLDTSLYVGLNEDGIGDENTVKKKKKKTVSAAEVRNHYQSQPEISKHVVTEKMISFTVHGEPLPLQRHRTARGIMYNPSEKYQKSFYEACKTYLPQIPWDGAIEAKIVFYMSRPKNHYRTGSYSHLLKSDVKRWHSSRQGK